VPFVAIIPGIARLTTHFVFPAPFSGRSRLRVSPARLAAAKNAVRLAHQKAQDSVTKGAKTTSHSRSGGLQIVNSGCYGFFAPFVFQFLCAFCGPSLAGIVPDTAARYRPSCPAGVMTPLWHLWPIAFRSARVKRVEQNPERVVGLRSMLGPEPEHDHPAPPDLRLDHSGFSCHPVLTL
jgi:hypothetical protein